MKRSKESGMIYIRQHTPWMFELCRYSRMDARNQRCHSYYVKIFLTCAFYRMTLRSRDTKSLESACAEIVARSKNQGYETKGPVRIPTKILRITTRKSPCGEGSKTWDRFEMRIHKRVIDIHCPSSVVKEITNFRIDPGVDVNLIVWKQ